MTDDGRPGAPDPRQPVYSDPRPAQALAVEGLEEEIRMLRAQFRALLAEKPVDYRLVTQVANTLVRAVATQHRISPKARKELADNIAAVLNSLGDQLLPADGDFFRTSVLNVTINPLTGPNARSILTAHLFYRTFVLMTDALERAIARFRPRPAVPADVTGRISAAAFRAMVIERLRSVERDVAELKARVNGLIFVVMGAVVTQLVLRVVG